SRIISGLKGQRVDASEVILGPIPKSVGDQDQFIGAIKEALYASTIISYAQGFALMRAASDEYAYALNMKDIARIWRAGCIIRAELLNDIMRTFDHDQRLPNLLMDGFFREVVIRRQGVLRYVIQTAIGLGIPVYALSSALSYFDAYRSERLPANLIQAQRDYFGAHTYQRVDMEGSFHTAWKD
ncbi:MAG: NADP-dependent phosphogluconate dehydrogenase, partial [Anaerolineales bacterium]